MEYKTLKQKRPPSDKEIQEMATKVVSQMLEEAKHSPTMMQEIVNLLESAQIELNDYRRSLWEVKDRLYTYYRMCKESGNERAEEMMESIQKLNWEETLESELKKQKKHINKVIDDVNSKFNDLTRDQWKKKKGDILKDRVLQELRGNSRVKKYFSRCEFVEVSIEENERGARLWEIKPVPHSKDIMWVTFTMESDYGMFFMIMPRPEEGRGACGIASGIILNEKFDKKAVSHVVEGLADKFCDFISEKRRERVLDDPLEIKVEGVKTHLNQEGDVSDILYGYKKWGRNPCKFKYEIEIDAKNEFEVTLIRSLELKNTLISDVDLKFEGGVGLWKIEREDEGNMKVLQMRLDKGKDLFVKIRAL